MGTVSDSSTRTIPVRQAGSHEPEVFVVDCLELKGQLHNVGVCREKVDGQSAPRQLVRFGVGNLVVTTISHHSFVQLKEIYVYWPNLGIRIEVGSGNAH